MRLYHKLILFMLAAAVGPVAGVGFRLLAASEAELKARIGAQQATAAQAAAELASHELNEAVESLVRAGTPIRWTELSAEEAAGALRLVAQQSRHFSTAAVLDREGREQVPCLTFQTSEGGQFPSQEERAAFFAAVPFAELASGGAGAVALSPTYARPKQGAMAAALAMAVETPTGLGSLAVELSLKALQQRAEEVSRGGAGALFLLDTDGRVVAGPEPELLGRLAKPEDRAAATNAGGRPAVARYLLDGAPMLAAAARTPDELGWVALIRLPESEAFAPVARMRRTVLLSIAVALVLLLAAGFAFTRGIARGIERVATGARAFAAGDLSARIAAVGSDETADLATTFNAMGAELQAARAKLETWNEELQRQVEERTRELKEAQAQLLETQKLAAIGQLGAGVAHEINNPLAGILGNAQLLLLDRTDPQDRETQALKKIEAMAKRAKEITTNLLRFSQQQKAGSQRPVDLNRVIQDTLTLVESQVKGDGMELKVELAEGLPKVQGDPGHLAQVLLALVSNARAAMLKTAEKRVTLSTASEGGRVLLRVADTGKGIAPEVLPRIFEPFFTTKDVWSNVGLGLSVSYRIVTEHRGAIRVQTEAGKGSIFTVDLPQSA